MSEQKKRKMHPNSLANLQKPFSGNDDERVKKSRQPEAVAKRKASARATYEEKLRRKQMGEELKYMLSMGISDNETIAKVEDTDSFEKLLKEKNISVQTAILQAVIIEAKNGNLKAVEFVRDTIGEKAPEKQEINVMSEAADAVQSIAQALLDDEEEETGDE